MLITSLDVQQFLSKEPAASSKPKNKAARHRLDGRAFLRLIHGLTKVFLGYRSALGDDGHGEAPRPVEPVAGHASMGLPEAEQGRSAGKGLCREAKINLLD